MSDYSRQAQPTHADRNAAHLAAKYERDGVVCRDCGSEGWGVSRGSGHAWLLVLLTLLGGLPGIIYGAWMLTTIARRCTVCNSASVVPRNSPEGVRMRSGR